MLVGEVGVVLVSESGLSWPNLHSPKSANLA